MWAPLSACARCHQVVVSVVVISGRPGGYRFTNLVRLQTRYARSGAQAPEPRLEGALQRRFALRRRIGKAKLRAFVPEIDVQALDLLDEQRDRPAGGSHFLA